MEYLSKQDVLKAYKVLSTLSPDPNLQGATQKVSAIRYFLALDMFCHKLSKTGCDTRSKDDKEFFTTCVGYICSVTNDLYTPNFYYPLKKSNRDYNVGSNFCSVGQVKVSLADPTSILEYPKRGNTPLFRIKNGELIRDFALYSNLDSLLDYDKVRAALVIWISRNQKLESNLTAYDSIKKAMAQLFSSEMMFFLMPETTSFIEQVNKQIAHPFTSVPSVLENKDIVELFTSNPKKPLYSDKYRQYITAIKSKPFLLLAGISGTGKSRIVRELARSCWAPDSEEYQAQKPRNFEMIQVKPNWHDSSELLGYVSRINKKERFIVGPFLKFMAAAIREPDVPYFLCLDEMNLAPVEQYLAEYLSVIESRKAKDGTIVTDPIIDYEPTEAYWNLICELFPNGEDEELAKEYKDKKGKKLTIPQNLIVVGTVNMDETTFSFSRKVLDRAMTIEMNEVNLWRGLTNKYEPIGQQSIDTLISTNVEGTDVYNDYETICKTCIEYLEKVNAELEGTPFKIAYRTRNEVLLYVVNNLPYNQSENGDTLSNEYVIARALDEITNMKILSRIEGDETKVKKDLLNGLIETIKEGLTSITGLQYGAEAKNTDEEQVVKSISIAKLEEMAKKLSESGYTSYWS